jgi:hypothetical protein
VSGTETALSQPVSFAIACMGPRMLQVILKLKRSMRAAGREEIVGIFCCSVSRLGLS